VNQSPFATKAAKKENKKRPAFTSRSKEAREGGKNSQGRRYTMLPNQLAPAFCERELLRPKSSDWIRRAKLKRVIVTVFLRPLLLI
jgi:hypothetical protein